MLALHMKTIMVRCLSRAFLALLLWGCEQTVVVDVPPHERQIVAKGLFSADSLWRVDVHSSVGYQEDLEPFPLLDATVEVWEEDRLLERLQHTGAGRYRAQHSRPRPGSTYRLRISAPEYAPVEARATLPVELIRPRITVDTLRDDIGLTRLNVSLTLDDPAQQANFYAIDVLQEVTISHDDGSETYILSGGFESADVILNALAIETGPTFFHTAYFEDDLFDGKTQTLSLTVQEPFFQGTNPDPRVKITLRFYTTTEAFFRYHKTLELQNELSDNPFAEPIRVQSNTSNGFGVFAGYQAYTIVLAEH